MVLVRRKKYNWWPVIIACITVGALLFIGTIAAVVMMRKRKVEESPIRPAEEEKSPEEERPTVLVAEVRLEPVQQPVEPQQPGIEDTQERLAEEPVAFDLASAVKPNPDIMSRLIQESPVDHDF